MTGLSCPASSQKGQNIACGGTTGNTQRRLTAVSSIEVIEWFTGWMLCVGLDDAMPVMVARVATSDFFEAQFVIQVAKVRTDAPEDLIHLGTVQTPTAGSFDYNPGVLDLSNDTAGAMFIRFGVAYNYASGQSQAAADVELEVAYARCGDLVGSGTWQINSTTTSDQFQVISGWVPTILVDKAKLAAICAGLTGNLEWRLAYRTAKTQKSLPSAWSNVTDTNAPYGSGEINTGDLPIALGSKMWVQFAVAYKVSAVGDSGQASLTTALGVRRT